VIGSDVRLFVAAAVVIAAVTVLLHERHYQSRRERILEARVRTLEEIIGEQRGA
jgi:predicted nucleic-acid-binding protein